MFNKANSDKASYVWLLTILIGIPQLAAGAFAPLLPDIALKLELSEKMTQSTVSIYFLGFALGVLYWGLLSDKLGRRKTMLLAVLVFAIASLGCAFAEDINWLLAFRFFNGFGASLGALTTTLVRDSFTDTKQRNKVMSSIAITVAYFPAIGSMVGGYLVNYISWGAAFWFLTTLGLVVFVICFFVLPETADLKELVKEKTPLSSVFIKILKDSRVINCAIIIGGFNAILFGANSELSFIFQNILGVSASNFGYFGVFVAIACSFGSMWARKLSQANEHSTRIIFFSSGLLTCGSFMLGFLSYIGAISAYSFLQSIIIYLLCFSFILFAFGMAIPIALSYSLASYQKVQGKAGAIFGFLFYIINSIFLEFLRALHNDDFYGLPIFLMFSSLVLLYCSRDMYLKVISKK